MDREALGARPSYRWGPQDWGWAGGPEPAFPAGSGGGGQGGSKTRQWAAAVGKLAPVLPEGGAGPHGQQHRAFVCAVTQRELAAPPRRAHRWSWEGWRTPCGGPHPTLLPLSRPSHTCWCCPLGWPGQGELGPLWQAAQGSGRRPDGLPFLSFFPSWAWSDHGPDLQPGLCPHSCPKSPWTCHQEGKAHSRLPVPEASPESGRGRWGEAPREAQGRVLREDQPRPPSPPAEAAPPSGACPPPCHPGL